MKSPENCPTGCSSLQAEIYFKHNQVPEIDKEKYIEYIIMQLHKAKIIDKSKLLIKDIRFEKYGNVIFDKNIYEA